MRVKDVFFLLRPQQYIKNLFVLAPVFFSGMITNSELLLQSIFTFILFSLTASAVYVLNDIRDIEEDKSHPKKLDRPIANGSVPVPYAWKIFSILIVVSLAGSYLISIQLIYILLIYLILNFFYSFGLKHYSILDISMISIGFVLRILAGSIVIEEAPSMWIILMTFLLAFFIALAKRRDDVLLASSGFKIRKNIEGYNLEFVNAAMVVMASVVIVAYIFYTISQSVNIGLGGNYLYMTVFFVIIGIIRYLQIIFVENNSGSPTEIVLKDRFLQVNIILWGVTFGLIIYGSRII